MYKLWENLNELKKYRWVELSHSLNNDSPYWAGIPDGSVELAKVCYDWGNPMLDCVIHTFKFPGQFGTHMDFPGHFAKDGALSETVGVQQLAFPLCVIDLTEKVAQDVNYAVTVEDIKDASDAIYNACGQYPTAFRSPGGNTTQLILDECQAENMVLYYWSLDTQDWKYRDAQKIYDTVINNVEDGDIILMHEIYDSTAKAVEMIVPELIKQGYQIVTCQELVTAKTGAAPEIGHQYMNATKIKDKTS